MPKVLAVSTGSKRDGMQPQKIDLLGIHPRRKVCMVNYTDTPFNSVMDLSSKLLEKAFSEDV